MPMLKVRSPQSSCKISQLANSPNGTSITVATTYREAFETALLRALLSFRALPVAVGLYGQISGSVGVL